MDTAKPLRLAVVYPWGIDFCFTKSLHSMLNLKHPPNCEIAWGRGHGWCSAARHNHCFRQALDWNADIILMLGADQVYHDTDMLCRLVEHYRSGHECVTALVPMRGYLASQQQKPFHLVAWRAKLDENGNTHMREGMGVDDVELVTRDHGPLVRVQAVGSGVIMFPADVLRKMSTPWCVEIPTQPDFDRGTTADMGFISKLQSEGGLEIMCDTTIRVTHLHTFEIDDSFPERFKDWMEPGKGDPALCDYRPAKDTTKISQARISPSIPFYQDKFLKRYELVGYADPTAPAFFFGCYSDNDLAAIQNHNSLAVVIWAGTDALNMRNVLEKQGTPVDKIFGPNVRHVAISRFIADDLKAMGLFHVELPLCNVNEALFKSTPREHKRGVYCYIPKSTPDKYGGYVIDKVKEEWPDLEWIINDGLDKTPEEMAAIYERCFIGIRPTLHDGLSNTVVEMGLMGRRVIWNGNTPNAIPWDVGRDPHEAVDSISDAIDRERNSPIDDNGIISALTKNYIDVGSEWKTVAFYDQAVMKTMTPELAMEPYDYEKYFEFRYAQGERGAGGPDPDGEEAQYTRETIRGLLKEYGCISVTEFGCGSMARWPSLPSRFYTGYDISETALNHARTKFPQQGWFSKYDLTSDEPPDQHGHYWADAVICIDVMQHIKPEDFDKVFNKLYSYASKVLIIKTSVDIPELYYQFSHQWGGSVLRCQEAPAFDALEVPGVPCSRIFVFSKSPTSASGGASGSFAAAVADSPLHLSTASTEVENV